MTDTTRFPVRHIPITSPPRPSHSACILRQRARSHPAISLGAFVLRVFSYLRRHRIAVAGPTSCYPSQVYQRIGGDRQRTRRDQPVGQGKTSVAHARSFVHHQHAGPDPSRNTVCVMPSCSKSKRWSRCRRSGASPSIQQRLSQALLTHLHAFGARDETVKESLACANETGGNSRTW